MGNGLNGLLKEMKRTGCCRQDLYRIMVVREVLLNIILALGLQEINPGLEVPI